MIESSLPCYIGVVGRISRPVVIPEPFTGEGQLGPDFENIAEVNKWDVAGKLQWLKVRLAGHAQAALQRFSVEANYKKHLRSGSNHHAERNAT